MKSTFIAPKEIKRYKSLDALMAAFFGCKEKNVSEYDIGGSGEDPKDNYILKYSDFKECVELQGIWGYIQNEVMHVWFKPDIPVETLITFIAHEAGHLNGHQYKNQSKEEKKAAVFEDVATYAYKNAIRILNKGKADARKKIPRKK